MVTIARWVLLALFTAITGRAPGEQAALDPAAHGPWTI